MEFEQQSNVKKKIITGTIIGLVVIALLGAIVAAEAKKNNSAATTQVPTSSVNSDANNNSSSSAGTSFKDGSYSASSTYYVPHGSESIKVTLTVKNNVVTDSKIENSEDDPESAQYQEEFASEYKSDVVGKNLGSVNLSFIAGASDTTEGFNQAVQDIANQAKA